MAEKLKTFSVIFTLTVVLFVLFNLVVSWFYDSNTRNVLEGHPAFDPAKKSSLEKAYNLPIADIQKIITEAWTEGAWIYEPYVQFRERPREGEFVNISEEGFRLNERGALKTLRAGPGSIFFFGGSTAFGYGVRDKDTIAAHLETILREKIPGRKPRVYNFGRGYYSLRQEFLLFQSLVQRGMIPEMAIFFNGVNEHFSFCPTYSNNIADMFQIAQEDTKARFRTVLSELPFMRLLRPSYRSLLEENRLYFIKSVQSYGFECDPVKDEDIGGQIVSNYLINEHLIRSLAGKYGIGLLFIVQPVAGYKNSFSVDPYGNKIPDRSGIIKLLEQTVDEPDELSLSGVLSDHEGEAFVDNVHYTSEANQRIAEAIAGKLIKKEGS